MSVWAAGLPSQVRRHPGRGPSGAGGPGCGAPHPVGRSDTMLFLLPSPDASSAEAPPTGGPLSWAALHLNPIPPVQCQGHPPPPLRPQKSRPGRQ